MKRDRLLAAWVFVAVAGTWSVAGPPEATEPVDWDRVKREWSDLSPKERARYEALGRDVVRGLIREQGPPVKTPGQSCNDVDFEVTSLPFSDENTTVGALQNSFLSQFGICAGGGMQWTGTGFGPDLVYKIKTDTDCDLQVTMDPEAEDLSLYVVTDCVNPALACVGVSDDGWRGMSETVDFTAVAGEIYFVWVDGFNGSSDAYTLTIGETGSAGCALVPVELQEFTVE